MKQDEPLWNAMDAVYEQFEDMTETQKETLPTPLRLALDALTSEWSRVLYETEVWMTSKGMV